MVLPNLSLASFVSHSFLHYSIGNNLQCVHGFSLGKLGDYIAYKNTSHKIPYFKCYSMYLKWLETKCNDTPAFQGWIQTLGKEEGSKFEHPYTELWEGTPVQIFNEDNDAT